MLPGAAVLLIVFIDNEVLRVEVPGWGEGQSTDCLRSAMANGEKEPPRRKSDEAGGPEVTETRKEAFKR